MITAVTSFHSPFARQIHRAAQHPVELDLAQADAVEARILLDLRIGAAFTRMQTLSLQTQVQQLAEKLISYGKLMNHQSSLGAC
jgi:DNA topoisomerase-3